MSTRRRWVVGVALGLLALLLVTGGVYTWWLGGGLASVSDTVQARAKVAQKQLEAFRESVKAGDEKAASQHLNKAKAALGEAQDAARAPQVRIAKFLPYTRSTVADLDHLLKAARVLVYSADDALTLYVAYSGNNSTLFKDGRVDVAALVKARDAMRELQAALVEAKSELGQVDGGGPMGDDALDKKRTGLRQIRSLQAELKPLAPLVEALPSAVGADGVRRYLVAIMNPAEMRASGGAPLSMAMVVLKDGKLTIPIKGTTSDHYLHSPEGLLGDSPQLVWNRVKGDPFQPPLGKPVRFVNTGFNPDFRVSGEQMMLATPKNFGMKTDGVIAIDVVALAKLLKVVGPIESDFGTLTSENLADELLVKAYEEQGTDVQARQKRNDQLMSVMLSNLMAGGQLRAKANALLEAVPARHVQTYFRDPRLEKLAAGRALDGAVPAPKVGNLTAVYTQNGNGSKVDVYQQRTVIQSTYVRPDGSALVSRTVRIANPTPPYAGIGPDIKRGYTTRWATNLVINLMPPGAKITKQPHVELAATVKSGKDTYGRPFAQAGVQTPPGGTTDIAWEYVVPHAAVKVGNAWQLHDQVVPQNTLNPTLLQYTVVPPEGWVTRLVDPNQFWSINPGSAFIQLWIDKPQLLTLEVAPQ